MSFANLPFKEKITVIVIGIVSLWIAIRSMPIFSKFVVEQIENKYLQEFAVISLVYLFAIWIIPIAFGFIFNWQEDSFQSESLVGDELPLYLLTTGHSPVRYIKEL